jgi:glycosyltransferase involved in cell wall biosynthesis
MAAVTVVVPTKDRPDLLACAVTSAVGQAGVDVAVMVVDDGSRVPVGDEVTALAPDGVIAVHRHDVARGVCAARNAGLARIRTPWVAFLDDDDLWAPMKLRRQLDAAAAGGRSWACSAAVAFTGSEVLDVVDPPAHDDVAEQLLTGNHVPGGGSGVLVLTDLLREVGGFDESLATVGDWDCWIRLAQRSPVARVHAADVGYRVHAAGMAHDVARLEREVVLMTAKYARWDPPLHVRPDRHFFAYLARLEYRGGNSRAALRRTWDLLMEHRHPAALTTPLRHALPRPAQGWLRARRLACRPESDWAWLARAADASA